ncbi:MAG: anthranilate phosphoribosyltransferase [Methylacidiphilales bacterium]|nr:anthranilate phosphoribosyltransferase [Candidatus Methylacidiphilales bacterium]
MTSFPHLDKLIYKLSLSETQYHEIMEGLLSEKYSDLQKASAITALSMTPIDQYLLTALSEVVLAKTSLLPCPDACIDTCGTGGDGKGYFNISTVSSFITVAAGIKVLKHGNRSASGVSGSADFLEIAGVKLEHSYHSLQKLLSETGFAFVFAPHVHPCLHAIAQIRKKMQVKTIFNFLGPLVHPAILTYQIVGVADEQAQEPMFQTLSKKRKRVMVLRGLDGCDECSVFAPTLVYDNLHGTFIVNPKEFGLSYPDHVSKELVVTNKDESFSLGLAILSGEITGPARAICILNAALAIFCAEKTQTLAEAITEATVLLDSRQAYASFQKHRNHSEHCL